jgi:hypothetical protein
MELKTLSIEFLKEINKEPIRILMECGPLPPKHVPLNV